MAARFSLADPATPTTEKNHLVNKEALIPLLGLSRNSFDEDIQSAPAVLKADASKTQELQKALVTAKSQAADPSQFVPIAHCPLPIAHCPA